MAEGENQDMNVWIYALGALSGEDIKIGHTSARRAVERLKQVNGSQTTSETYKVLVAVLGSRKDEQAIGQYFAHLRRTDKGARTEYFRAAPDLVEYINWLRSQWWVSVDGTDDAEGFAIEDSSHWLPRPDRRIPRSETDPAKLVQDDQDLEGPLAGTTWDWLVSIKAQVQDYFTDPAIVDAARQAMGGIDLDAASHWLANRELRIPDYFHTGRSAFTNDWHGRVWLNPPYGNNAPWIERICHYVNTGDVKQLCMLSPTWAFTTKQAEPLLELVSAHVLLSPTPTFWGNALGRTGSNHPHSVVYIGDRVDEFLHAFSAHGIPMQLSLASAGRHADTVRT